MRRKCGNAAAPNAASAESVLSHASFEASTHVDASFFGEKQRLHVKEK